MGFRSRFAFGLGLRLGLLLLTLTAFVQSLYMPHLGAARLLAALIAIGAGVLVWRYINSTNRELARFIDAVRFGDLSQGFSNRFDGTGFSELGLALDEGIRKLRDERHRLSDTNRFYESVLDDTPIALLTVEADGKVELANKAARRLLIRHQGVRPEDFEVYGSSFAKMLRGEPGPPRLVPLTTESVPQTAMVSSALVHRLGGLVRVVAVQPIQGELNAVEIAAQSDLIRVLTHEIMNSMTPVTSLAHTAAQLMGAIDSGDNRDIRDARSAVETLARRADGVMHFVESYRQISRAPEVRRKLFEVLPWARELESLFRASDAAQGVAFSLRVDPPHLTLDVDPDLMCQVLINLMKNGADAARGHAETPAVSLSFAMTKSGRTQVEVADNGPGVPQALRRDIFLPFFTTKAKGTGVGLSLARQVVLAHRGSIAVADAPGGGALFRLVL